MLTAYYRHGDILVGVEDGTQELFVWRVGEPPSTAKAIGRLVNGPLAQAWECRWCQPSQSPQATAPAPFPEPLQQQWEELTDLMGSPPPQGPGAAEVEPPPTPRRGGVLVAPCECPRCVETR